MKSMQLDTTDISERSTVKTIDSVPFLMFYNNVHEDPLITTHLNIHPLF